MSKKEPDIYDAVDEFRRNNPEPKKPLTVSVGMFRAIHTKYIGPSNRRGSRIKAFDEAGNSVTIGYDDDLGRDHPYIDAARKLCEKMGWAGRLVGGGTKGGYTFVFVDSGWDECRSALGVAQATIERLASSDAKRASVQGTLDVIKKALNHATEAQ